MCVSECCGSGNAGGVCDGKSEKERASDRRRARLFENKEKKEYCGFKFIGYLCDGGIAFRGKLTLKCNKFL